MTEPARLLCTTSTVPPYPLQQFEVMRRAQILFGDRSGMVERLLPVFENSGIEQRYSCVPIEWYDRPHDWPERNEIYLESALNLLEAATRSALREAGLKVTDIDCIVVVSTTGIATPSLDARLMDRMGMRRDVRRLPIFGLGCAGGVIGLSRAATMASSDPGSMVLFLVVELCALSFRRSDVTKSNIVATALFGDGAAAALLSTRGAGPRIVASGEHTWPDSLDIMGWEIMQDGMKAIFSRDIPNLVTQQMREVALEFLARHDLRLDQMERFICHPGGAKVLDALEFAFGLAPGALVESREILRDYGNMSAATVMFVLEKALQNSSGWNRALLSTLGPGFSAGFMVLENR